MIEANAEGVNRLIVTSLFYAVQVSYRLRILI